MPRLVELIDELAPRSEMRLLMRGLGLCATIAIVPGDFALFDTFEAKASLFC